MHTFSSLKLKQNEYFLLLLNGSKRVIFEIVIVK